MKLIMSTDVLQIGQVLIELVSIFSFFITETVFMANLFVTSVLCWLFLSFVSDYMIFVPA